MDTAQSQRLPPAPRVFVLAQPAAGSRTVLAIRSAATGAVVRKLRSFGEDFTNNGLALSPDGREVYFTLIPRARSSSNLLIERLDVRSGVLSLVAHGWEPSLSPNGRSLAFISGRSERVEVEDLATRRTRGIGVDRLLGRGHVLAELPPAWLGDNQTFALLVTRPALLVSSPAQAAAQTSQPIRMIVVHAPPDQPLSAEGVLVAGLGRNPDVLGDGSASRTLIAASLTPGGPVLDRLRLSAGSAGACRLVSFRGGLVLGFDQSGRRLLYLVGSNPPELWRATIEGKRLIDARRLLKNADLGAVAW